MPKNIVILFDGTSNEISEDRTNILRLYGTLKRDSQQVVFYDPGVGTLAADNALFRTWPRVVEFWGQATGYGLDTNVKEAYRFLVQTYAHGKSGEARDRIYLFGFSRGAYSARVLAGFIHAFGLMTPDQLNLLDYVYRAYKRIGEDTVDVPELGERKGADKSFAEMKLFERALQPDRPPIRLLGLFDTVASVIERGVIGWRLRSHAFTRTNRSVQSVRHAVAIDERRVMFRPNLWPEDQPYWGNPFNRSAAVDQDAVEVWFRGVHGDIGGGYPEKRSALAKVPLDWMIRETGPMGLKFKTLTVNEIVLGQNPKKHYVAPDGSARPQDSMDKIWPALEFLPAKSGPTYPTRRATLGGWHIPFFEPRVIPEGARIHRTVVENDPKPGNLPMDYVIAD